MKMSSILEKSTTSVIEKRSFFLRTSSIQKIKCSATYPFRLAGTKLNRDAIKELIEVLIIRGRVLAQIALLNLYIATFKLVGAVSSLWESLYAKKVCDKSKKTDDSLSFQQRLLEKIQRIQNHKSRLEPNTARTNRTPVKTIEQKVATPGSQFQNEIAKLRELSDPKLKANSSMLDVSISGSQTIKNNDYLLSYIVYGSAALIYLQLLFLALALNSTTVPPGLVFLITSLLLIALIAFKVFFLTNMRKIELRTAGKEPESPAKEGTATKTVSAITRQSRPRLKNMIDLSNKTLSKIKLL